MFFLSHTTIVRMWARALDDKHVRGVALPLLSRNRGPLVVTTALSAHLVLTLTLTLPLTLTLNQTLTQVLSLALVPHLQPVSRLKESSETICSHVQCVR